MNVGILHHMAVLEKRGGKEAKVAVEPRSMKESFSRTRATIRFWMTEMITTVLVHCATGVGRSGRGRVGCKRVGFRSPGYSFLTPQFKAPGQ